MCWPYMTLNSVVVFTNVYLHIVIIIVSSTNQPPHAHLVACFMYVHFNYSWVAQSFLNFFSSSPRRALMSVCKWQTLRFPLWTSHRCNEIISSMWLFFSLVFLTSPSWASHCLVGRGVWMLGWPSSQVSKLTDVVLATLKFVVVSDLKVFR